MAVAPPWVDVDFEMLAPLPVPEAPPSKCLPSLNEKRHVPPCLETNSPKMATTTKNARTQTIRTVFTGNLPDWQIVAEQWSDQNPE